MKYVALLFSLFFSFAVYANPIDSDSLVSHLLVGTQKTSLHFIQTKRLPDVGKPFKATGVFQFVKGTGFIIKQENPKKQKFVSTTEKFCSGDKTESLKDLPYFLSIKLLIDRLLSGDTSSLSQLFDVSYKEDKNTWRMTLKTTQEDLKNFISKIKIRGNKKYIKKISVEYTDGVKIDVDLSPIQLDLTDEIKC